MTLVVVMGVLMGGGVWAARRRGYRLTAAILLMVMLGGTLPVPLYVLCERQMGFGPLGVTMVFAAYSWWERSPAGWRWGSFSVAVSAS